jgi:uncharacterized membrane protein YraQ (UPF0718 family)
MLEPILKISQFIAEAFLHIWPYVIVTIPLAVAVQMSGASKYIKRAFEARPLTAVVLATVLGAFSPFCSCGVIPVIASLLISGVPLAPVMSFWIASPSMDPEIFFLSVGMIGWELAIWRLAATLVLSLGAGFITHLLMQNGWLGQQILRTRKVKKVQNTAELFKKGWQALKNSLAPVAPAGHSFPAAASQSRGQLQYALDLAPLKSESTTTRKAGGLDFSAIGGKRQGREVPQSLRVEPGAKHPVWKTQSAAGCSSCSTAIMPLESPQPARVEILNTPTPEDSCSSGAQNCGCNSASDTFRQRLFKETLSATTMVIKFMALAFFLEALIILYVPPEWITAALGRNNPMAIATAAVLGVPTYTSSLTALPMISGLLTQGMNPAAALAFLIAGPVTTLPAMAAVWPLVARRVFFLYVSFALVGAIIIGYLKLIFG